jgi:prevent-host-death family protein
MREVQASAAKSHLPQLLDAVERGESIVITRHGRRIARIVPEVDRRREEVEAAMRELEEFRRAGPGLSTEEILTARHEGHKY